MSNQVSCPVCGTEFPAKRSNQKYCNPKCAKNATRGSRTVDKSPAQRQYYEAYGGSYSELSQNFYDTPPQFRVDYMERLLQEGRRLVAVRRILARSVSFQGRGNLPIQQIFHHYCREIYGMTVSEILNKANPLPTDPVYPFEYYGPFTPSLYTDGTYLKRSEQPFVARRGKISEKLSTGKPYDWAKVAFKLSTDQEKRSATYISSPKLKMLLQNWNDTTEEDDLEKIFFKKAA